MPIYPEIRGPFINLPAFPLSQWAKKKKFELNTEPNTSEYNQLIRKKWICVFETNKKEGI